MTIGHAAVIHGCTIEDQCLIGMGAILLNGAHVGTGSIVAAGTLVVGEHEVPPRSLVMGSPGKVKRLLTQPRSPTSRSTPIVTSAIRLDLHDAESTVDGP